MVAEHFGQCLNCFATVATTESFPYNRLAKSEPLLRITGGYTHSLFPFYRTARLRARPIQNY